MDRLAEADTKYSETAYEDALSWIHSTLRFGSKLGLERVRRLAKLLGDPQDKCEHFHIAGTNGKGSVAAMIASSLHHCGYRTGMNISPYLEDFRERITINGRMIHREDLVAMVSKVRPAVESMVKDGGDHPTEFEVITALAFLYYAQERCDYVSLEVGLGGRFDATNIVNPLVSVITTIALDHTDRLGNTLGEIASEKAGIIKPGVPVVTGALEGDAFAVISDKAHELGSPLYTVGKAGADVTWEEVSVSQYGQVVDITGPWFRYQNLRIPLLGRHQQQNAALAVTALEVAGRRSVSSAHGFPALASALPADQARAGSSASGSPTDRSYHPAGPYLDPSAVAAGIAHTVWPGRMEVLSRNPTIIIDGAHNAAGAIALRKAMSVIPRKRLVCVYGILGDKSFEEATSYIAPMCDEMVLTLPDTPRSLDLDLLSQAVRKYVSKVHIEPNLNKAFDLAIERVGPEDALLACGSLYLVGPLRAHIRRRLGMTGLCSE